MSRWIDNCVDCDANNPEMFNCDDQGERVDGLICYPCWKAKHPTMQKVEYRINPALVIWGGFLGWVLVYCLYKLTIGAWSYIS